MQFLVSKARNKQQAEQSKIQNSPSISSIMPFLMQDTGSENF
jgi:hypothetical protein